MKTIALGCPYNGISDLKKSLKKLSSPGDLFFDIGDISAVDTDGIYLKNYRRKITLDEVSSSFIRYPYDLIPPHSGSYRSRERTEFYKTVAMLLSGSAVNKFSPSFAARNRMFSLNEARKCKLATPVSVAVRDGNAGVSRILLGRISVTKSLGNCYYAEKLSQPKPFVRSILLREKDGGETAYIYPAHLVDGVQAIKKYVQNFGTIFIQSTIFGKEFRVYVVGREVFFYERARENLINEIDKSGNELRECAPPISAKEQRKIIQLTKRLGLNYLCLDAVVGESRSFVVIDINPFGSFPRKSGTRVVDALARFMYSFSG